MGIQVPDREEETYSSLLTKPLVTRGVLRFTPPSRLEKNVLEPAHERYVVEGDLVTFESERKRVTRTISLDDYPALRGFVEAFRAGLTGDAVELNQVAYSVYYNFFSIHLRAEGYTPFTISACWAFAVAAEVFLIYHSGALIRRFGYVPENTEWLVAIRVDGEEAGLTPAQAQQALKMTRK